MPYEIGERRARIRTIRTPTHAQKFLEGLANTGNVSESCRRAGISRVAAYEWREADAEFAEAWERAAKIGVGVLEDEARRRAVEGVEEPVVSAGKLVTTVRKYSDSLLTFLMKAHDPKYRDHSAVELTGKDGGPIETLDVKQKLLAKLAGGTTPSAA